MRDKRSPKLCPHCRRSGFVQFPCPCGCGKPTFRCQACDAQWSSGADGSPYAGNAQKNYQVRPAPTIGEESEFTYFAVIGPRVDEYAVMDKIARIMENALNQNDVLTTI